MIKLRKYWTCLLLEASSKKVFCFQFHLQDLSLCCETTALLTNCILTTVESKLKTFTKYVLSNTEKVGLKTNQGQK